MFHAAAVRNVKIALAQGRPVQVHGPRWFGSRPAVERAVEQFGWPASSITRIVVEDWPEERIAEEVCQRVAATLRHPARPLPKRGFGAWVGTEGPRLEQPVVLDFECGPWLADARGAWFFEELNAIVYALARSPGLRLVFRSRLPLSVATECLPLYGTAKWQVVGVGPLTAADVREFVADGGAAGWLHTETAGHPGLVQRLAESARACERRREILTHPSGPLREILDPLRDVTARDPSVARAFRRAARELAAEPQDAAIVGHWLGVAPAGGGTPPYPLAPILQSWLLRHE